MAAGLSAQLPICPPQATIASITAFQAAAGVTDDSLLNFVVSDGATLVATRFASENTQVSTSVMLVLWQRMMRKRYAPIKRFSVSLSGGLASQARCVQQCCLLCSVTIMGRVGSVGNTHLVMHTEDSGGIIMHSGPGHEPRGEHWPRRRRRFTTQTAAASSGWPTRSAAPWTARSWARAACPPAAPASQVGEFRVNSKVSG